MTHFTARLSALTSTLSAARTSVLTWLSLNAGALRSLSPLVVAAVLGVSAFALGDGWERTCWILAHLGWFGLVVLFVMAVAAVTYGLDGALAVLARFRRR